MSAMTREKFADLPRKATADTCQDTRQGPERLIGIFSDSEKFFKREPCWRIHPIHTNSHEELLNAQIYVYKDRENKVINTYFNVYSSGAVGSN